MTNETVTIKELEENTWERLELHATEIHNIFEVAKPKNYNYVGTNVFEWLSSYEIVDTDFLVDRYSDEEDFTSIDNIEFEIVYHDNSYNWSGNSNIDIDFKGLVDIYDNMYLLVKFHIGTDIRAGYTNAIMLDLNAYAYSNESFILELFDYPLHENNVGGYVEINGTDYSIKGHIDREYLTIYNHETDSSVEVYDAIYCWDETEKEFDNACIELVKEHIDELN